MPAVLEARRRGLRASYCVSGCCCFSGRVDGVCDPFLFCYGALAVLGLTRIADCHGAQLAPVTY